MRSYLTHSKPTAPRPLAFCAAAFACGVGTAALCAFPLWGAGVAVILAGLCIGLAYRGRGGSAFIMLMAALFFLCGWMRSTAVLGQTPGAFPAHAVLTGTVNGATARTGTRTEYILKDVYIDGNRSKEKIVLTVFAPAMARPGDRIRADAALSPVENRSDSEFDVVLWRKTQGICIQAQSSSCEVVGTSGVLWDEPARFASSLKDVLRTQLDAQAGLVIGMTLGDTQWLSDAELQAFRDSGAAHVLAVSGLHIGFVMVAVLWLCKRLRIRNRLALCGVLALLWTYCLMVGLPVSAVRACLMASILCIAQMLGLPYDLLTSIFASALMILCVAPLQLFTAGFCLSFAAVLGIALWRDNWSVVCRRMHLPAIVANPLALSLSAQMGVLPVGLWFFGRASHYAVLSSLLVVPLAGMVMIGGLCAALAGLTFAPAGWILAKGVQGLAVCMQWIVYGVSRLPGAVSLWQGIGILDVLLCICAMAITSHACLWKTRTKWCVAALLVALCWIA